MRFAILVAAFGAACLAAPASAQSTIVQNDSLAADHGFAYFDTSLGTLQSVRLDITPDFTRGFQIIVPGQVASVAVSWDASAEQFCRYGSCTDLVATGSSVLALTYSDTLLGGSSYGYIQLLFGGSTISANLDPSQFINPPFPGFRRYLTQPDPGLYNEELADIFTVSGGGFARNANSTFGCNSSISGCDRSNYKLTYSYAVGGVPEPATWAMMLIGFGGVGYSLRRRRVALA